MTMHLRVRTLAALTGAALLAAVTQGSAQNLKYKPISVKTPDGLTISAQEWGNPAGPEILLIHGYAQSHMSWMRQVDSDLARGFRIITYDLRGHGNSDKPDDKARYHDNKAWGDEVKAVMDAAGLKRPVLVGWSYAGRVISSPMPGWFFRFSPTNSGKNLMLASTKLMPASLSGPDRKSTRLNSSHTDISLIPFL